MRRRAIKWSAIVAAALVVLSLADSGGFRRSLALRREIREMEEKNRALAERNQRLIEEIQQLRSDPAALERAAREELGFVRPGELVFTME